MLSVLVNLFTNVSGDQLKTLFDTKWTWYSRYASAHPKTATAIAFTVGVVAAHFLPL